VSESSGKSSSLERKRRNTILLLLLLLLLIGLITSYRSELFGPGGLFDLTHFSNKALSSQDSLRIADSLSREQVVRDSLSREQTRLDSLRREKLRLDSLQHISDSLTSLTYGTDSLSRARFVKDSLAQESINRQKKQADSLTREQVRLDSLNRAKSKLDSLNQEKKRFDSLSREKIRLDSLKNIAEKKDTIAPWVYPDPSGGLHFSAVKITFFANEPSDIFWRFSSESQFKLWDKGAFVLSSNEEIFFYGIDGAGNRSETKSKKYVFEKAPQVGSCPNGMTFINSEGGGFCIDVYEWPNKKGAKPISNVSVSEASDSCFSKGKRLCTSNEWESACEGKHNWSYPYGSTYEQHACVTQENSRKKSGEFGECRGWYAVHDMVGNLAEWTSTPASQDKRFNIVKGGFWESGKAADCRQERYSYYPQNKHNPGGFRCCKDSGNK